MSSFISPQTAKEITGYQFKNESILKDSLKHSSSVKNRLQSNERMEFLGDAILGFVVCEYLYDNYPDKLEGEMTKIKSAVVSRRVCAIISCAIKLDGMLELGKGMENKGNLPSSVCAAVFEAIIAAIYLDGGIDPARKFILKHIIPFIEEAIDSSHLQNFKSILQQYLQRNMSAPPKYKILNESGPDHAKNFEICAEIDGHVFPSAQGKSKKQGEQKAALNALKELGIAIVNSDGSIVLKKAANDL